MSFHGGLLGVLRDGDVAVLASLLSARGFFRSLGISLRRWYRSALALGALATSSMASCGASPPTCPGDFRGQRTTCRHATQLYEVGARRCVAVHHPVALHLRPSPGPRLAPTGLFLIIYSVVAHHGRVLAPARQASDRRAAAISLVTGSPWVMLLSLPMLLIGATAPCSWPIAVANPRLKSLPRCRPDDEARLMKQYLEFLRHVRKNGARQGSIAPAPARCRVFGHQMRFDLAAGFPLVTTKKLHFKSIAHELLWFLRGETNIEVSAGEHGVSIWDEWADSNGELGPVYGKQWRSWPARRRTPDRPDLARWSNKMRTNPDSRRIIVSAWNVGELDQDGADAVPRVLPVLRVGTASELPALSTQRGHLPGRALQHRLLRFAHPHARAAMRPGSGRFHLDRRRRHLYANHLKEADEQLSRVPLTLPKLVLIAPATDHFRLHLRGFSRS